MRLQFGFIWGSSGWTLCGGSIFGYATRFSPVRRLVISFGTLDVIHSALKNAVVGGGVLS